MYRPKEDCQIKGLKEIYYKEFGFRNHGTFIEIGAFDGSTVSNTCFLADIGWSGYYVEPVQEYALLCTLRHLRNDVRVLPCAIGAQDEYIEMSIGAMISSARKDHVEIFNQNEWSKGHHSGNIRKVQSISINTLLGLIKLKECDLAVIDVEGLEPDIIKTWDFSLLRPSLFIIESRDKDPEFPASIQLEYTNALDLLKQNGYDVIIHDGCNVILRDTITKSRSKVLIL